MGLLQREGRDAVALPARCIIGRGRAAGIRVEDGRVSSEHARLTWARGHWVLRDLGSRNGTYVDGKRLKAGQDATLRRGTRLGFADAECPWTLVDEAGPEACARDQLGGELVLAQDGLLALPSADEPTMVVFEDRSGTWMAELDGDPVKVEDGEVVVVGERSYRLHLPVSDDGTIDVSGGGWRLDQIELSFEVSGDQEDCTMTVVHPGGPMVLQQRVFHYMLMLLARQRIEDRSNGIEPPDQGWVYSDELATSLQMEDARLNVQIFRARQELGKLGIGGAAGLVERRRSSRKIRLGVPSVEVKQL